MLKCWKEWLTYSIALWARRCSCHVRKPATRQDEQDCSAAETSKLFYLYCEWQRSWLDCTNVQTDQCLCYLQVLSWHGSVENSIEPCPSLRACNFNYHKFPKYSDTPKHCCNHSKIWTMWLYYSVMSPNDAGGMANSADPDQTAPLGAVSSGSTLFAQHICPKT